jgi:hypothetical protein
MALNHKNWALKMMRFLPKMKNKSAASSNTLNKKAPLKRSAFLFPYNIISNTFDKGCSSDNGSDDVVDKGKSAQVDHDTFVGHETDHDHETDHADDLPVEVVEQMVDSCESPFL